MVQRPPIIDMRPDGSFQAPPRSNLLLSTKVALAAIAIVVIGGGLMIAALAIWFISLILPAVVLAAAVAYIALKLRGWTIRRGPPRGPLSRS